MTIGLTCVLARVVVGELMVAGASLGLKDPTLWRPLLDEHQKYNSIVSNDHSWQGPVIQGLISSDHMPTTAEAQGKSCSFGF